MPYTTHKFHKDDWGIVKRGDLVTCLDVGRNDPQFQCIVWKCWGNNWRVDHGGKRGALVELIIIEPSTPERDYISDRTICIGDTVNSDLVITYVRSLSIEELLTHSHSQVNKLGQEIAQELAEWASGPIDNS